MIKRIIKIILITLIISLSGFYAQASDIQKITLDAENILTESQIEFTIDNVTTKYTIVKQNDTLYIESNFFADYFGTDERITQLIKNSVSSVGMMEKGGEKAIYLPLFTVAGALGLRYTYSDLYGKEVIRLRSDKEFKVYKDTTASTNTSVQSCGNYTVNDNPKLYGNTPYTPPGETTMYTMANTTDQQFSVNGYPNINYSIPGGYGYCYPEDYQPGYYFGSYGFVSQAPVPQNVQNSNYYYNTCNSTVPVTNTIVTKPLGNIQY